MGDVPEQGFVKVLLIQVGGSESLDVEVLGVGEDMGIGDTISNFTVRFKITDEWAWAFFLN